MKRVTSGMPVNSRICMIYTGGTIGMKKCIDTGAYKPVKGYLEKKMKKFSPLHDPKYEYHEADMLTDHTPIATPISMYGRRIIYAIEEMDPIVDSSNMDMTYWAKLAKTIEKFYTKFDGFVVVHGTDTMAYTASALSFMLENLGKSVILTGSQIPLSEQRNDGVNNLLGALIFASHYTIPEVSIYFNNKLFRGNRSTKRKSEDIDAFDSPNMSPLAIMGTHITVKWHHLTDVMSIEKFRVHSDMCADVAMFRIFPGMTVDTLTHFLRPPIRGVILLSYGAGNGPDAREDLLNVLREACDRGIIIVNITQCIEGTVSTEYNTGKVLMDAGIVPGGDMTPEAALTKLSYALTKDITVKEKRKMIVTNLRGEMSVEVKADLTSLLIDSETFLGKLIASLDISSSSEMKALRDAILPTVMCTAAVSGNVDKLKEAVKQKVSVNLADYDWRTPLHLAACEGSAEVVEYLLSVGASVHARDRFGGTPLIDAIKNRHHEIVDLMLKAGAHVQCSEKQIADYICGTIAEGVHEEILLWKECGASLSEVGTGGYTPLHFAVMTNNLECYKVLLEQGADLNIKDSSGYTVTDLIQRLGRNSWTLQGASENGSSSAGLSPCDV